MATATKAKFQRNKTSQSILIQDLQEHLSAIVESSDDAIISKSFDGEIIYWNQGAERIYGYTSKEVLGRSINILAPAGKLKSYIGKLNRISS